MTTFTAHLIETDNLAMKTPYGQWAATGSGYDREGWLLGRLLEQILTKQQIKSACLSGLPGTWTYDHTYYIDGVYGVEAMIKIARHAGWDIQEVHNNEGKLIGFECTQA